MGNVITGTDLEIDVGKNYKGKLNIYGKTEQETRSGKNLCPMSAFDAMSNNGVSSTYDNVEHIITMNENSTGNSGKYCRPINNFEIGKKYTLSFDIRGTTGKKVLCGWNDARKTITLTGDYARYSITILADVVNEIIVFYSFSASSGGLATGEYMQFANVQIEEGEVATAYEPYGASPTPEFPSEIENVEGKNLYEIKGTANRGVEGSLLSNGYLKVNGTPTSSYSDCTLANTRNLLAGNYSISITSPQTFNVDLRVTYEDNTNDTFTINIGQTSKTITTTKNIVSYRVLISGLTTGTAINSSFGFMLEEGSVATEYVPYNSLAVKVTGKNLFDVNNAFNYGSVGSQTTINSDGTITTKCNFSSSRDIGTQLFLEKNTDYTISLFINSINASGTRLSGAVEILEYDGNDNSIGRLTQGVINNIGQINTFTFNSGDCEKWALTINGWFGSGYSGTLTYSNVQIEKGTEAKPYEPYKEQTVYFPLSEGQKLMEGSYLADDGVHNVRKQIVLDGTEGWSNQEAKYDTENRMFFASKLSSKINADLVDRKGLCNYFKNEKGVQSSNNDITAFQFNNLEQHSNYIYFKIEKSELETLDVQGWVKWLGEHKPVVEYELAEEEIIPYTEEQQEAWNEIQNIYLFEGKNYFNNLNAVKPKLNLTYLKIVEDDTEFYISENGRLVISEYDISYLIDFNASNIPSMPEAMEAAVRVVGKDGDIHLNTTYEPISFSIVCYTDDNLTPEEKVREEQKVNRFMNSIKNDTKILGFETENKFYDVKYSGALTTIRFPAHLQFTIPIKSSESYAKDLIKKSIKGNGLENSETIKDVGATFTIKGPAQTPKISFNNYEIFYDNVLLENTELVIDSSNSTVTHINNVTGLKTNAMRYYNHQFPKVRYGENVLSVNSGIDDASQVKVEWNDLKL